MPLKLAYALTVHKAQGMTIDRLEIDARHMHQVAQFSIALGRGS